MIKIVTINAIFNWCRRNTKEQKSFEVAMARIKPPTGHDDASTLQIRYSSPPEHQYEEIRFRSLISSYWGSYLINKLFCRIFDVRTIQFNNFLRWKNIQVLEQPGNYHNKLKLWAETGKIGLNKHLIIKQT